MKKEKQTGADFSEILFFYLDVINHIKKDRKEQDT